MNPCHGLVVSTFTRICAPAGFGARASSDHPITANRARKYPAKKRKNHGRTRPQAAECGLFIVMLNGRSILRRARLLVDFECSSLYYIASVRSTTISHPEKCGHGAKRSGGILV